MRRIMWDPSAYTDVDEDEYTRGLEEPGGNHAVFELYRATETDADQNRSQFAVPLECPVLAVGGRAYLAAEPGEQMAQVAMNVAPVVIEQAGAQQPVGGTRRTRALLPRFLRDRERMTVQRRLYRRAGVTASPRSGRRRRSTDSRCTHSPTPRPTRACLLIFAHPARPGPTRRCRPAFVRGDCRTVCSSGRRARPALPPGVSPSAGVRRGLGRMCGPGRRLLARCDRGVGR